MSFAITGVVIAGVGMVGNAQSSSIQGGASRKATQEQTKQSKAKQEELNSNSSLSRAIQKINNDRIMRAADKTFTAAATNLSRNRAAAQTSNIMQQVANAEAAGAYAANVASKGIGGGSVEVIENTMALRDSLKNQLTTSAQSQADYDAVQTLAGIIPAGWLQQDMTVLSGNTSAAAAVPQVTGGFNWAQALGNSPVFTRASADFMSGFGPSPSVPGTGVRLSGDGGLGVSAPRSGFWSSSSTTLL